MSSWLQSPVGGRGPAGAPNGSGQQLRLLRRVAPYPQREDRPEEPKDALDSYEELEQMQNYSSTVKFEGYKHPPNAKSELCTPADKRKGLYQRFYRQVQEDKKPADCVVLSVTTECLEYPKSLSQCLQERGLSVEMLYLQVESGLTRALQDVRAVGSPLCILVEQKNIALCSCTVIIFSESLKIHRNMPKDQAMDFVQAEYNRSLAKERPQKDPSDIAAEASQLLDDFLDREKIARHVVPPETKQLLLLLADGVHLYSEELDTVSEFLTARQEHLQAFNSEGDKDNALPQGLGKPPPLLPTPTGPSPLQALSVGGGPLGAPSPPVPLLPTPGSHPKTKPPPLLSLQRLSGPPLGGPGPRGSMPLHHPYGPPGVLRGPLFHHGPPSHPGLRGLHWPRLTPPSLKNSRPPLLSSPGLPFPRQAGLRH
ncbi:nuclear receptor coactivator 5 [Cololabis saira]|uniref:nuclear receptor coactivator 5 n=1 Tax=Cololabis saira TaxID=129043 RepID=UPI002AD3895A|nr:nuclear receptor coactivator 5 [Cololabis saira]